MRSISTIAVATVLVVSAMITPVQTLVVVPEFYAQLQSSLAQTAASYASKGQAVPVTLDDYTASDGDTGSISTNIVATFGGGCFWGLELAYQREPGVLATCVGYTQGTTAYPSYKQVCAEETGHTEAVLLVFDSTKVSYKRLADLLFDRIPDPTTLNRVGRDRGTQYRTGMYAHSVEQLHEAQTEFERENRSWAISGRPVVTEVKVAAAFWPAEEEHQRYLEKGGRFGRPQSTEKGASEEIRCYG
jgi:peptide-methionine (S)-S-oxide reductase